MYLSNWNEQTYAPQVSIRWRDSDFTKPTAASTTQSQELSTGAKAGIALGVTSAILIAMIFGFSLFFLRQKRQHELSSSEPLVDGENGKSKTKKTNQTPAESRWCLWRSMSYDSWFYETIAICFSAACLAATACLLYAYNKQPLPKLPSGLTLNAVISILATASKSSLIFAVGECIGQLRWLSFRKAAFRNITKPLSLVQIYDSASRGPWGSMFMLFYDKGKSLVTVGSLIMILSLAFDPFVQQILRTPVQGTAAFSREATVEQCREFTFGAEDRINVTGYVNNAIYDRDTAPTTKCSSGNCTWPLFPSFEICSRCEDVTSKATIIGCDSSLLNLTSSQNQTTACNVSLSRGISSSSTLEFFPDIHGDHLGDVIRLPYEVVWNVEIQPSSSLSNRTYAGIKNPLVVFAHALIDLSESGGDSAFNRNLDHIPGKQDMNLTNVTQCALSYCSRTWNVSVAYGVTSSNVISEDLGETYLGGTNGVDMPCWRSNSSSIEEIENELVLTKENQLHAVYNSAQFDVCDSLGPRNYIPYFSLPGSSTSNFQRKSRDNISEWTTSWREGYDFADFDNSGLVMVEEQGLEVAVHNIAFSLSKKGREFSNSSVLGTMTINEVYVEVHWNWIILPAILILSGSILIASTALVNTHQRVSLWKTSVFPFLYHGLEKDLIIPHEELEHLSTMEQAANVASVSLGLSKTEDRLMFQRNVELSSPSEILSATETVRHRVSRRQTL